MVIQNMNHKVREYCELMTERGWSLPLCEACDTNFLPPRALCPTCGSDNLAWTKVSQPEAIIYSLTRMANGKTIVLAELDVVDGPGRLFVEVVGNLAEQINIGDRVTISTVRQEFELGSYVPAIVAERAEQ